MKDSIRIKITFWYSLTIAVILIIFSLFLYQRIENVLYEHIDETLFLKAEDLGDSILSFIDELGFNCSDLVLCDRRLSSFIADIINSDIDKANFTFISLGVLNIKGEILYKSLNFPKDFKFSGKVIEELEKNKAVFETIFLEEEPYRAYFTSFVIKDRGYIMLSLRPLTTVYLTLKTIKVNIIFAIPITVFLTAFLGIIMVRITLKPVDDIIKTAKQITEKNLSLRINLPRSRDEIYKLANTFNSVIERLEKTFTNQKDLIQGLSHQIKTPLTIIKGEIELSLKRERDSEAYRQTLLSISEEVERIRNLVENLLMISRLENFEVVTKMDKVGIIYCVKKAIEMLEKYAKMRNIDIKLEEKLKSDFFVYFDEYILIRTFYNIIENAIKYSFDGSSIIIRVYDNNGIVVEIEDFGLGISEVDLEHIFKRFYRGKNTIDKEGFGLGLFLSKSAVEKLNGKIEVIRKEKGVIFKILFKKN